MTPMGARTLADAQPQCLKPAMSLHHTLAGRHVTLEPMTEAHREGLRAACDADPDTWNNLYPFPMHGEHFGPRWDRLTADAEVGRFLPFAVMQGGEVAGLSCYITPDEENRSVEIGFTYYRPEVRGGAVNPEAKRLLLGNAFDQGFDRLQFKVDAINARSRAAVLKLGAVQEGINRADMVTWTGRVRDTVVFSILADEWPDVRQGLDTRLAAF
jgi:RimJ/RimL family protein N-acetyltransferase